MDDAKKGLPEQLKNSMALLRDFWTLNWSAVGKKAPLFIFQSYSIMYPDGEQASLPILETISLIENGDELLKNEPRKCTNNPSSTTSIMATND